MPGSDPAVLHPCLQPIVVHRSIALLRDVFLAAPHHFYRAFDVLRDAHCLADAVDLEPAPEATADDMVVDRDFGRLDAEHLRGDVLRISGHLRAHPYLAQAVVHMHGAIHWLHGGVGEEWELERRLENRALLQRGNGIANLLREYAGAERGLLDFLPELCLVEVGIGAR